MGYGIAWVIGAFGREGIDIPNILLAEKSEENTCSEILPVHCLLLHIAGLSRMLASYLRH